MKIKYLNSKLFRNEKLQRQNFDLCKGEGEKNQDSL